MIFYKRLSFSAARHRCRQRETMTNKELQDKLRKFPDDMEVKIELDEYFYAKCASPYKVQRLPIGEEFIVIGEFGKL